MYKALERKHEHRRGNPRVVTDINEVLGHAYFDAVVVELDEKGKYIRQIPESKVVAALTTQRIALAFAYFPGFSEFRKQLAQKITSPYCAYLWCIGIPGGDYEENERLRDIVISSKYAVDWYYKICHGRCIFDETNCQRAPSQESYHTLNEHAEAAGMSEHHCGNI